MAQTNALTLAEYKAVIQSATTEEELETIVKRAYLQDDEALSGNCTLHNEVVMFCYRRAEQLGCNNSLVGKRAVVSENGNARYGTIVAALTKGETKSFGMHGRLASIYMDDTHKVEDFLHGWEAQK